MSTGKGLLCRGAPRLVNVLHKIPSLFCPIEREESARDLFGLFHASTERGEQLPHGLKSMWQSRRLSLAYAYVSEREIKKMRGRRGKEERGMNRLNE